MVSKSGALYFVYLVGGGGFRNPGTPAGRYKCKRTGGKEAQAGVDCGENGDLLRDRERWGARRNEVERGKRRGTRAANMYRGSGCNLLPLPVLFPG